MIFILYSETSEQLIRARLGDAEYSYYFVLKEFRPVLEKLGEVVVVRDPETEVDPIFHAAKARGEDCVFLSFSPPHRTPLNLTCPTVPVLAWEFDSIANETWYSEPEQDWRFSLNALGRAIVHSADTVRAVRDQMGADFPVVSIPSPVWDGFAPGYKREGTNPVRSRAIFSTSGRVVDTRGHSSRLVQALSPRGSKQFALDGVIYLSIFNPKDGRKNIDDMVGGFCRAFRDVEDATLVLKLTHHDLGGSIASLKKLLRRLQPFKCRVLLLGGYLETEAYQRLVAAASYAVNTSIGEGQCLPLMELMSCGKPAVAPSHTGMADYVDGTNAFLVQSSAEPASWPQDPRHALRTLRRRIDFGSVVEAYRDSYRVAKENPARYFAMSESAHEALRRHCSGAVTQERVAAFLALPWRGGSDHPEFGVVKPRADAPWLSEVAAGKRILNYSGPFDSVALWFAKRGAKVDAVGGSTGLREAAKEFGRRYHLDLSFHDVGFGVNLAGSVGAYDLILFDASLYRRRGSPKIMTALRAMLSPEGKILIAGEQLDAGFGGDIANAIRRLLNPSMKEDALVKLLRNAGFVWRRYHSKLDEQALTIYEFRPWTRPLQLGNCSLTEEEEVSWHGQEPHGRWTREYSFLEIPARDGTIEVSARNYRGSRAVGEMSFGGKTTAFDVESNGHLQLRFAQSGEQADQRLIIRSDTDLGGPNDPRELGLCVETISPI